MKVVGISFLALVALAEAGLPKPEVLVSMMISADRMMEHFFTFQKWSVFHSN